MILRPEVKCCVSLSHLYFTLKILDLLCPRKLLDASRLVQNSLLMQNMSSLMTMTQRQDKKDLCTM